MMYFDYPEVKESERLTHAESIDGSRVLLSPAEAWAELKSPGEPDGVTLAMFDRRPAYLFRLGRNRKLVYADSGQVQSEFSPELNLRTAAAWTGQQAGTAKTEIITAEDQWTVGGVYRSHKPLTKYSWPNGEEVYLAAANGLVVQYTTRRSRLGAWLGPIPHWLYFTPLRAKPRLWSRIVICLSGAATVVAILGLIAGLSIYSPAKRIPYSGPKRLHMILGLFFGLLACTWAFSGMLSMDPFPMRAEEPPAAAKISEALSGEPFSFALFTPRHPREALAQLGPGIRRLEFLIVAGEPFYLATGDSAHSWIVSMQGEPRKEFDPAHLIDIASKTAGPVEARLMNDYDAYYLDRDKELPLPVLRIRLNDRTRTILYIDPRTARIVTGYSSAMWAERWLYHGLHSINLPWLYNHRPAWDIVVLTLMLGGTSLAITSVIIAWRLLRRSI